MPDGSIFWTLELSCGFELIFCAIGLLVLPLAVPAGAFDPVGVDVPVAVLVVAPAVFFGEWPCVVVVLCPAPFDVVDTAA